jgi:signal transduction histidine kinase
MSTQERTQSAPTDEQVWRRAVEAHDRDDARLATDLDDQAVQPLAAALLGMDAAAMALERGQVDQAQSVLLQSRTMVRTVTQRLRSAVFELMPPSLDSGGVVAAARSLVGQFRRETGIGATVHGELPRLGPESEMTLYRTLQVALSNVMRHSQAGSVEVSFSARSGRATMKVQDDGEGTKGNGQGEASGNGSEPGSLAAIRARLAWLGGSLQVRSTPGSGTQLIIHVPA